MYTTNGYGADIGGDWNTQSDTSLAALSFSEGVLTPDFASDKTAYTLTLPQGVTGIRMTAPPPTRTIRSISLPTAPTIAGWRPCPSITAPS